MILFLMFIMWRFLARNNMEETMSKKPAQRNDWWNPVDKSYEKTRLDIWCKLNSKWSLKSYIENCKEYKLHYQESQEKNEVLKFTKQNKKWKIVIESKKYYIATDHTLNHFSSFKYLSFYMTCHMCFPAVPTLIKIKFQQIMERMCFCKVQQTNIISKKYNFQQVQAINIFFILLF